LLVFVFLVFDGLFESFVVVDEVGVDFLKDAFVFFYQLVHQPVYVVTQIVALIFVLLQQIIADYKSILISNLFNFIPQFSWSARLHYWLPHLSCPVPKQLKIPMP